MSANILKDSLAQGKPALLCESPAVCGCDLAALSSFAGSVKDLAAVMVPDNPGASVAVSGLAAARAVADAGATPVLTMSTRDRNRLALQSDLLGAAALGIENVFCTTGVHPNRGEAQSMKVYDLDAVQLLSVARGMAEQKKLISGCEISGNPDFFLGATVNPFVKTPALHLAVTKKKAAAGAKFLVTSPVLDAKAFGAWLELARKQDALAGASLIASVIVLKDAETAAKLAAARRGISVPGDLMKGLTDVKAGVALAIEQLKAVKAVKGVAGILVSAPGCEEAIPEVLAAAK